MSFVEILQSIEHYSIVVVFAVFTLILATTYWPGRKPAIERNARIVLDDDCQGASCADQD